MLLLAVMWGLSIPVTKLGLLTLPPLTLTALRFAIAVPLLVPQGCVGELAAEIRHGRESATTTRALAQIVAAQLAVLIPTESA